MKKLILLFAMLMLTVCCGSTQAGQADSVPPPEITDNADGTVTLEKEDEPSEVCFREELRRELPARTVSGLFFQGPDTPVHDTELAVIDTDSDHLFLTSVMVHSSEVSFHSFVSRAEAFVNGELLAWEHNPDKRSYVLEPNIDSSIDLGLSPGPVTVTGRAVARLPKKKTEIKVYMKFIRLYGCRTQ